MYAFKCFLFGLFIILLFWSSKTFWKDIFLFFKKRNWVKNNKETDSTEETSNNFGVSGKEKSYLHPLFTELNNRTRWYSTELWQVAFVYIGITAVAIGQVIDKGIEYLPYIFGASAFLGLFVVWHMTRLRKSEQRHILTLALIESELGVPKPNRVKTNPLPKPFQFAIIVVVFFYGLIATMPVNLGKVNSESVDKNMYIEKVDQDKIMLKLPESIKSNIPKDVNED